MLVVERSMTEYLVLGIRWIKLGQKQVIVIFWNSFVISYFMRWVSMVNRLLIWHILFNAWIRYEHAKDIHPHWTESCCIALQFDAGSHDKICLTSRDEQNVIIVSYSELHQAFERAFTELMNYGAAGSSWMLVAFLSKRITRHSVCLRLYIKISPKYLCFIVQLFCHV